MAFSVRPPVFGREVWLPAGAPLHPQTAHQKLKKDSTMFVHYSAFAGMSTDTKREQIAVMRAIYHDHTTNPAKEWDDIAYNFVVFQPYGPLNRARIFVGRGWTHVPASQQGCNSGNWSVCVVSLHEPIKGATLYALRWLYAKSPSTHVLGHKQCPGSATSCPGTPLMEKIPRIREAK
jgi:hypothetical protein